MNINRIQSGRRISATLMIATAIVMVTVLTASASSGENESPGNNKTTIGTGAQYKTTVHRQTKGELSEEDFRQVSTLAPQILQHLNAAVACLEVGDQKEAKAELNQNEKLIHVIRDMLPVTIVTTVTENARGEEVYRDENHIQDDLVPIYEMMTSVDVVAPIIDAKKEGAALQGLRLSDAEIVHTSVLLDISYVDRKISRALELLSKEPEKAREELNLAQTVGVDFSIDKEDSPLVKAQRALRLAERMINENKMEGAEENLEVAKIHLEEYRSLAGPARKDEVDKIQKDIGRLFGKLEKEGAESTVRDLWHRVTGWLTQKSGQTHQTAAPSGEE